MICGKVSLEIWSHPCCPTSLERASISYQKQEVRGKILCYRLGIFSPFNRSGCPRVFLVGALKDFAFYMVGFWKTWNKKSRQCAVGSVLDFCGWSTDIARKWRELLLRHSNPGNKPAMVGFKSWMFTSPVSFLISHCFTSLLWNEFIKHISSSWIDYSPSPLVLFTIYSLYLEYIYCSHSKLMNFYTHFNSSLQMLFFLGRYSWSIPSLI